MRSAECGIGARGTITSGDAFLLRRFASDHACCLTLSAKQAGLRQVSFLFREGWDRRLHVLVALRGYRACAFLGGDPDGVPDKCHDESLVCGPEEVQEATGKSPGGRISLE